MSEFYQQRGQFVPFVPCGQCEGEGMRHCHKSKGGRLSEEIGLDLGRGQMDKVQYEPLSMDF